MTESLTTLIIATTLLLGSPGPVPLALAATGAVIGFRRGIPFLLGILTGLAVVIFLAGTGIAALFDAFPWTRFAVQIIGSLYIGYVAFKIATAPVLSAAQANQSTAPSFRDGVMLNLLNPKAYAAFVAIFSQFQLPLSDDRFSALVTGIIAYGIAILVDLAWLSVGGVIRPLFTAPVPARVTRIAFAILMLLAVLYSLTAT